MIDFLDKSHGLSQVDRMRNFASQLGGNYDVSGIKVSRNGREYLMYFYQPVKGGSQSQPGEWEMSGYNEIQNPPERNGVIDRPGLLNLCGFSDYEQFTELGSRRH